MEEQVKKAYEQAETELKAKKDELINKLVKEFVQDSLERIEELEEQIKELEKEKKELKTRLADCKDGRIDLLKEKLDKVGERVYKKVVPFIIVQPININHTYPVQKPWYEPSRIWYGNTQVTCNGNEVKQATFGTYCLSSGSVVDLR
jgi:hypothetical protein